METAIDKCININQNTAHYLSFRLLYSKEKREMAQRNNEIANGIYHG